MNERTGIITFQGNPLTLMGNTLRVGDKAPDFMATANDMSPVEFSSFRGKTVILSSVPSLDTPVCDTETRRFNVEAGKFGPDVVVLTISMDLPFAQKRWCAANGISHVQTVSDYRETSFGISCGMLIKELKLLARAVFIVDRKGIIRYIQLVKEVTNEPDYGEILDALKNLA
ncbi:thiol peroxidase [bacterium]|nr:thiol peroxidase [bacterium]